MARSALDTLMPRESRWHNILHHLHSVVDNVGNTETTEATPEDGDPTSTSERSKCYFLSISNTCIFCDDVTSVTPGGGITYRRHSGSQISHMSLRTILARSVCQMQRIAAGEGGGGLRTPQAEMTLAAFLQSHGVSEQQVFMIGCILPTSTHSFVCKFVGYAIPVLRLQSPQKQNSKCSNDHILGSCVTCTTTRPTSTSNESLQQQVTFGWVFYVNRLSSS